MYQTPDTTPVVSENPLIEGFAKLFDRHEDPMIRAAGFNGQSSIQFVQDTSKLIKEQLAIVEDFNKEFTEEDETRVLHMCQSMFETRRVWKELDASQTEYEEAVKKAEEEEKAKI